VTTQTALLPASTAASFQARARSRASRTGRRSRDARLSALCAALICAGSLGATPSHARTAKPSRAASTPSTAQILAPSAATKPDALPPDRQVFRCGNTYSPHPCAEAKPLDVSDARSDDQRAQAEDVAARDKRLASWMEAQRRERDTPASAPGTKPAKAVRIACVESAAIACVPKKPRPRHATSKAASGAGAR
jgi:hypothetical protein